jgi:RHS repeat-associated protein
MVMTLQKTREKFTGFDGVETCESETPQGYSVSWSKTNQRTIDANGSISSDNMYSYAYDAENRLIQVNFLNPQPTNKPDTVQMTYDGLDRRVAITELHGTTVLTAKTFVWSVDDMCQERDITGHTINKQFFDNGEQINGTDYYFVFDHLGSVREMTDANGVVHASYDYDSFGRQTKILGDMDCDFGYTDFYVNKTLCLNFAEFRVYDSDKGRWLSRDPMEETEGPNLYAYVLNDVLDYIDPDGLSRWEPVPGCPGWDVRKDPPHVPGDQKHRHYKKRGKPYARKVFPDGKQVKHGPGVDEDIPKQVLDAINSLGSGWNWNPPNVNWNPQACQAATAGTATVLGVIICTCAF